MIKFLLIFFFFYCPAGFLLADIIAHDTISPDYKTENCHFNAIAVSHLDKIYLTEKNNHELYELSGDGIIIKKTGGFGWDDNNFNYPADIAINAGLNIIVADKNNHRLLRFDRTINYITTFPDENRLFDLQYPIAVEISRDGELFILQENSFEIVGIDSDRNNILSIGSNVSAAFRLTAPIDIHLNYEEELLVLEQNGRILSYDRYGTPLQIHLSSTPDEIPKKIIEFDNTIYILTIDNKILKLTDQQLTEISMLPEPMITDFYQINDQLYLLSQTGTIYIFTSQK